jgi:hypothetical protein
MVNDRFVTLAHGGHAKGHCPHGDRVRFLGSFVVSDVRRGAVDDVRAVSRVDAVEQVT